MKKITYQLNIATCALLQVTATATQAANHTTDADWKIDTAFLYYSESDSRVSAFEPAIYAGKDIGDEGERIDLRLVIDALTGATPNGAHASSEVQTFTTPSGKSSYQAGVGETPLDDTFKDTRVAIGADWTLPINRLSKIKLGVNASKEFDYLSLGVSGRYTRDLNNKNTTLSAGLSFNSDTYTPEGKIPKALTPMKQANTGTNREGSSDTKTVTDLILGLTQIISRQTIISLNYSYGLSNGYLTDPFKIVSIVDATGKSDNSALGAIDSNNLPYIYEKRPDSRQRNTVFFKVAHHLTQDVIHFSYRYFWDDWGISSNTFDLKYRYAMGNKKYLQPHIRYYMQDAADFYRHNLVQGIDVDAGGSALVKDVSSDSRLAKLTTTTIGLKYGYSIGADSELSLRGEYIKQTFDDGNISSIEKTPELGALIFNMGYTTRW